MAILARRPMEQLGILTRLICETEMLVEENWIPIVRVASALKQRRFFSGDELDEFGPTEEAGGARMPSRRWPGLEDRGSRSHRRLEAAINP